MPQWTKFLDENLPDAPEQKQKPEWENFLDLPEGPPQPKEATAKPTSLTPGYESTIVGTLPFPVRIERPTSELHEWAGMPAPSAQQAPSPPASPSAIRDFFSGIAETLQAANPVLLVKDPYGLWKAGDLEGMAG